MSEITPAQIKGLWFHLVRAVGGVDAAGAFLGVSKQRVSVLQSVNHPDLPTVLQIATLERVVGQAIVTGALAEMAVDHASPRKPALVEACEVAEAAAKLLHLARMGASPRDIEAAVLAVQREAADVPFGAPSSTANAA